MEYEELTEKVIGCAIEVHKMLGPGLLESAYEQCLSYELTCANIGHECQKELPILYKGMRLDCGYRLDILVKDVILIELKSVDLILPIHEAQLLTYMKLAGVKVGFLMNFNVTRFTGGLKRYML